MSRVIPPDREKLPQATPRAGTGDRELGAKLRYMRELRRLPLKAAASRAKLAPSSVSDYEHARRTPSVYALARLSKVYGVSPYYFMDHLAKLDQDPAA